MGKFIFRPHYIDDWASSDVIEEMDMEAEGVFHRLLDLQWRKGHVPETMKKVRSFLPKISLKNARNFDRFFDRVFPVSEDGLRRNPRCHKEREKALVVSEKRAKVGRKGAAARHGQGVAIAKGEGMANGVANDMAKGVHSLTASQLFSGSQSDTRCSQVVVEGGCGGKPPPAFFDDCLSTLNEVPGYRRARGTTPGHVREVFEESGLKEAEFAVLCRSLRDEKIGKPQLGEESVFAVSPCSDLRQRLADGPPRPSKGSPQAKERRDDVLPAGYVAT